MKRINKNIAGNSLTEFALVVPLLAIFINFTIYLNEVALEKIKPLDIGRYLAFAATDVPGSNYVYNYNGGGNTCTGGSCAKRGMEEQKSIILENVKNIEKIVGFGSKNAILQNNMEFVVKDTELLSKEVESLNDLGSDINQNTLGGQIGSFIYTTVYNLAGGSFESLYNAAIRRLNFNLKGDIYVAASVKSNSAFFENLKAVDNAWQQMNIKTHKKESQVKDPIKTDWLFSVAYEMSVDSWKLEDGRNIRGSFSSSYDPKNDGFDNQINNSYYGTMSPFEEQIEKMWLGTLSLRQNLKRLGADAANAVSNNDDVKDNWTAVGNILTELLDNLLTNIPGQPFTSRLTSIAYDSDQYTAYENGIPVVDGMMDIDIYKTEGRKSYDKSIRYFHTLPMVEEELTNWTKGNNSEYYKTWEKRGQYFMGCPNKKQVKCTYDD